MLHSGQSFFSAMVIAEQQARKETNLSSGESRVQDSIAVGRQRAEGHCAAMHKDADQPAVRDWRQSCRECVLVATEGGGIAVVSLACALHATL